MQQVSQFKKALLTLGDDCGGDGREGFDIMHALGVGGCRLESFSWVRGKLFIKTISGGSSPSSAHRVGSSEATCV